MILIDALFIANEGGGPVLLRYLLDKLRQHKRVEEVFLLLDARFNFDLTGFDNCIVLPNRLKERIRFYKQNKDKFTRVFCFTNIAPPVKLKVPVYTYFHNQLLLESIKHKFSKRFFPFYIRYLFLKLFNRNTDYYIVQTQHMADAIIHAGLKDKTHCLTLPFFDMSGFKNKQQNAASKAGHFAYISSSAVHKNNQRLLEAWGYLNDKGIRPYLHLTLDNIDLVQQINDLNKKGTNIVSHGYASPAEVYAQCSYLVYPSLNESFGLGLVEAAACGLKIIAADLPYVRSVVEPSGSFDPLNVRSIAAAVEMALEKDLPDPHVKVDDRVEDLIKLILG